jgi:hypothetical protein
MISFKIEPQNHATFAAWSKKFFFLAFLVGAGTLMAQGFSGYRSANAILKDHTVVTVPVALSEVVEEKGSKGRVSSMYHFAYTFEVEGQSHEGEFVTSESNADPYLGEEATVEIAYANGDASRFDRLSKLQGQAGLGGLVTKFLIALVGAAFLAFVAHMLLVAKLIVPRAPEPEAAAT